MFWQNKKPHGSNAPDTKDVKSRKEKKRGDNEKESLIAGDNAEQGTNGGKEKQFSGLDFTSLWSLARPSLA